MMNGTQAMDRLEFLNSCHEMGGGRLDNDEEEERARLDTIYVAVGGRNGLEGLTQAELESLLTEEEGR